MRRVSECGGGGVETLKYKINQGFIYTSIQFLYHTKHSALPLFMSVGITYQSDLCLGKIVTKVLNPLC